ncbi:hypothetical protein MBLNU230_g7359t1 [Neophaeotheca triangularis]
MGDKLKNLAKGGWHPEKDRGGGQGFRKDMSMYMGRKQKDPDEERRASHQSRPLNALQDPDSFGPPPKHSAYYGPGASAASSPNQPRAATGGLGGPVPARQQQHQQAEPEPPRQPEPYRRDTTGLSTANLPKPPVRRNVDSASPPVPARGGPAPPPRQAANPAPPPRAGMQPPPAAGRAAPAPPPRLPPRQNEYPDEYTPPPPPTYNEALDAPQPAQNAGHINQGAASRLSQAGVQVPGFGIGSSNSNNNNSQQHQSAPQSNPQLGELQSRFSRMTTNNNSQPGQTTQQQPQQSGGGTTWKQKQDALKTAQSFRNDPSSVSFSDARATASTANNFRERHGAQVASAASTANNMNQKYGISQKFGSMMGQQQSQAQSPPPPQASPSAATPPPAPASAAGKKAAPPPPPKKSNLAAGGGGAQEPPPIPMSSKPRPS